MSIFNKIVVVIILIFIVCLSVVGIFNAFTQSFNWSDIANKYLNTARPINMFILIPAFLIAIVFCIFILVLEFYRKNSKTALVASVKEGRAMISLESAANQIKESISKISGTADAVVKIIPKSKGVILNVKAKICADCNVPEKMQEIIKVASAFTFNKLGIKVYKTNLIIVNLSNIQYEPSDTGTQKTEVQNSLPVILEKKINNTEQNHNGDSNDDIKAENIIDEIKTENNINDSKTDNVNDDIKLKSNSGTEN